MGMGPELALHLRAVLISADHTTTSGINLPGVGPCAPALFFRDFPGWCAARDEAKQMFFMQVKRHYGVDNQDMPDMITLF